ncbi:MAG: hypothetical protein HOG49_35130 [Candidatus Scalindua sp.]|nr:hypothetical protein [Candidatus Scalindua sp.]
MKTPKTDTVKSKILFAVFVIFLIVIMPKIFGVTRDLITKSANSYAGNINTIIAYIAIILTPLFAIVLARLKLSTLTSVLVAGFPLFARFSKYFNVSGYINWQGYHIGIGGLALISPIILIYIILRYNDSGISKVWRLSSVNWFKMIVVSGFISQFFFTSFSQALPLGYLVAIPQFTWFLVIIISVNNKTDAEKIILGIIVSIIIAILLKGTAGGVGMLDSSGLMRLSTNTLGSINQFAAVLASTLSLIPAIALRIKYRYLVIIGIISAIFIKELVMSMCRGAFVSMIPIFTYLYILDKRQKRKFIFAATVLMFLTFSILVPDLIIYLTAREFYFDTRMFEITSVYNRLESSTYTLNRLLTEFPNIIVGFGYGTYDNWDNARVGGTAGVHSVHQGLLSIWATAGLFGLIGFIGVIYNIYKSAISNWKYYTYSSQLLVGSILLSVTSWLIFLNTTSGNYIGGQAEVYGIMTTEMGLIIALTQKVGKEHL